MTETNKIMKSVCFYESSRQFNNFQLFYWGRAAGLKRLHNCFVESGYFSPVFHLIKLIRWSIRSSCKLNRNKYEHKVHSRYINKFTKCTKLYWPFSIWNFFPTKEQTMNHSIKISWGRYLLLFVGVDTTGGALFSFPTSLSFSSSQSSRNRKNREVLSSKVKSPFPTTTGSNTWFSMSMAHSWKTTN